METKTNDGRNNQVPEKVHIFDRPKNVKRVIWSLYFICGVLFLLDLFVHRHRSFSEGVFSAEGWIGYYAFYGWVACVLLVLTAKQMRKILMRKEDYYER
jgi:hypothetical protein